jgi:hypothetical protein
MIISGSVVQLRAQGPTAVGGGAAVAPTKVESGAVQILNCWMSRPGPNTPDYNLAWRGPNKDVPTESHCPERGNTCKKICEIRNQGTIEPTDYGYKLTVTLDATEYTRNDGAKSTGGVLTPGTVLLPNECVVRIDQCPELPELESLQFDFKGIAVSETGTVSMIIPYVR